jgi:hypothetical protein
LRQRLRNIDPELVRRRVLARVEALAAVVAQVREIGQVALAEREALLDRRETRAVLLAVPAGVAHRHRVRGVLDQRHLTHDALRWRRR